MKRLPRLRDTSGFPKRTLPLGLGVLTNGSERDRKNPFGIKVSQHKAPLGEICYRDDNGI